jgi:hypothetical protein
MIRAYRREEPEPDADAWLEEILRSRRKEGRREEENLYCFVCGRIVTQARYRISVDGTHRHSFTNPGGYRFEIGCFREAQGCEQTGEFTDFYSWFTGYAWRYAMCRSCRVHLGWVYKGEGDSFFGLVLDRLRDSRDSFPSES